MNKTNGKINKLNRLVVVEKEKGTNIVPIPMDLNIVYEDKNLLIVNKPPQLVVHPTQKKVDKTLANGIVDYFLKTTGKTVVYLLLISSYLHILYLNPLGLELY